MKKKIFISGKIKGDPNSKEKFAKMEEELKGMDYIVLNPTVIPEELPFEDHIRISLIMVKVCDCIIMLPDWQESDESKVEIDFATKNDIKIFLPTADDENAVEETPNTQDD